MFCGILINRMIKDILNRMGFILSLRNDELNNAKQIPIYSNSQDI